ncbi:N-acetylmuramidase family protein [Flavitalea antarctica]
MSPISKQSYIEAAEILNCEPLVIETVAAVESGGSGFLPTGEVKILFEPHIFWKELEKAGKNPAEILAAKPDLKKVLYKKWMTFPYGKNSEQWPRLMKAAEVDIKIAHLSASYGKFQIMGFNHKAAGYNHIFEFTQAHEQGEAFHLKAFSNLLLSWGLDKALQKRDWTTFAKKYNGAGYHQNTATKTDDYDFKLNAMYWKLKRPVL